MKTPENLLDIYLKSVGRGSNLILNIPPDRRGLLNENDVKSLLEWKKLLDKTFAKNLAFHAKVSASSNRGNSKDFAAINLVDGNKETYWTTDDNIKTADLIIDLATEQNVKYILLQEYIKLGQRVKAFTVDVWNDNKWQPIASATTIGYKRILPLNNVKTRNVRIRITDSKACPILSNIEIY